MSFKRGVGELKFETISSLDQIIGGSWPKFCASIHIKYLRIPHQCTFLLSEKLIAPENKIYPYDEESFQRIHSIIGSNSLFFNLNPFARQMLTFTL